MHQAIVLIHRTKPSDAADPRSRLVRSPHCPNDVRDTDEDPDKEKGTCGSCAWGFYDMSSSQHKEGEDASSLTLAPVLQDGGQLGYRSQCGGVEVFRDQNGRVGVTREIEGRLRFFPGILTNWAFRRFVARFPDALGVGAPQ